MFSIRPLHHLHDGLVIRLPTFQFSLRDDDVMHKSIILRNEESEILLHTEFTDNLVMSPTDNLDDHCLLDMLVTTSHIRHLYPIAIHCRHGITFRHEDWCSTIVRQERVATVGFPTEHTLLYLGLHVQTIGVFADFREKVVPCHLLHHVDGEHLQGMRIKF